MIRLILTLFWYIVAIVVIQELPSDLSFLIFFFWFLTFFPNLFLVTLLPIFLIVSILYDLYRHFSANSVTEFVGFGWGYWVSGYEFCCIWVLNNLMWILTCSLSLCHCSFSLFLFAGYEITLVCLSVCLSVCPSLSFVITGLLDFYDIVHDDNWPCYLVTDKDFWRQILATWIWVQWVKIGPKTRFFAIFPSVVL